MNSVSMLLGFCLVSAIASTNTMIQALTQPNMKGRIMGYYTICFVGGSALGSLFLGWLSNYFLLSYIMLGCGVVSIVGILIYLPYKKHIVEQQREIYTERGIIPEIAVSLSKTEIDV